MKSILIVCDQLHDATSFYRAAGPFSRLRKENPALIFTHTQKFTWADIDLHDAVFALRPATEEHVKILSLAKSVGKPIWIDYDDDLTDVPPSNPAHEFYASQKILDNISRCMEMATVMTVSTKYLAVRYSQIKEAMVIPNAIDEIRFKREVNTKERSPVIFWRGTNTHDKDLAYFTQCMDIAAKEKPKASFVFMGRPFWMTIEQVNGAKKVPTTTIMNYLETISRIAPKIVQVPLWDCSFNRAKSNIAHLESSFSGALTLAPNWEEWKIPGVLNYNDPTQYLDLLLTMIEMSHEEHQQRVDEGWAYIEENLTLGKVNALRRKVLNQLLN